MVPILNTFVIKIIAVILYMFVYVYYSFYISVFPRLIHSLTTTNSNSIMRFLVTGSFLLVALVVHATTTEEWSWGKDKAKNKEQSVKTTDSGVATDREAKSIDSYSVANDDGSQESEVVPANSTDTQGRHVIRDRLCGLGLMEVMNLTKYVAITFMYL